GPSLALLCPPPHIPGPPRHSRLPYTTRFRSLSVGSRRVLAATSSMVSWSFTGAGFGRFGFVLPSTARTTAGGQPPIGSPRPPERDRKSTRLNFSHSQISYAVFCLKKKRIYR